MPFDPRTTGRNYPIPHVDNSLMEDFTRLIDALNMIDDDVVDLLASLASKISAASPALTGTPTAPTPTAGDSSSKLATTSFVATAIANLISSSPSLGSLETVLASKATTAELVALNAALTAAINLKANSADALLKADNLAGLASRPDARANLLTASRYVTSASSAGDRTIGAADVGRTVLTGGGGTIALSLPAANTLADGWFTEIMMVDGSAATITPASGTINGAASISIGNRDVCRIVKDGTNFRAARVLTRQGLIHEAVSANPLSGSADVEFLNIPDWATELVFNLNGVSLNAATNVHFHLGDASNYAVSGYTSYWGFIGATNYNEVYASTPLTFEIPLGVATRSAWGTIRLTKSPGLWHMDMSFMWPGEAFIVFSKGVVAFANALTRVRFRPFTASFDAGHINLVAR